MKAHDEVAEQRLRVPVQQVVRRARHGPHREPVGGQGAVRVQPPRAVPDDAAHAVHVAQVRRCETCLLRKHGRVNGRQKSDRRVVKGVGRTRVLHENAAGGGGDLELSGDGFLRVDVVVGAARVSRVPVAAGQHLATAAGLTIQYGSRIF